MPFAKKDATVAGRVDKGQAGVKGGFRTDSAISNARFGAERALQPWVPDPSNEVDGSLEGSSHNGTWDQFAENEKRFGIKTDYDENIYTTVIDKSHPKYRARRELADKTAREIERSQATTSHVAEERIMDHVGGDDAGDEEDKYSGVQRHSFAPLAGRENKYTPPAKRAPAAQATVTGAPVDPAIISSQVRDTGKRQIVSKTEEPKSSTQASHSKDGKPKQTDLPPKGPIQSVEANETKAAGPKSNDSKQADKSSTLLRAAASANRTVSPQTNTPSATSTVERDVLNSFKTFASQQRQTADKMRTSKAKADKEVKLTELKKFAEGFKLSTPVPSDLISIIAKDPAKQKEIQAKALLNAEEVARTKVDTTKKEKDSNLKENQSKPNAVAPQPEARTSVRSSANQFSNPPGAVPPSRHPNNRQSYVPQHHAHQPFRNDRSGQHNVPQNRAPLGQRLRNVEQQKMSQGGGQPHAPGGQEMRMPPTGPANNIAGDPSFGRRLGGAPGQMGGKLNPNSHEFRPNPYATSFNPNSSQASASSSPLNNVADPTVTGRPGQLIRRKARAINVNKCFVLAHVKTFKPPQGRHWDDNDGLRPSYDTLPTWRQIQEENEKVDSTMRLTYKEFLEQQTFAAPATTTPTPPHASSNTAHHSQLPLHLPHAVPSMPLHGQHGHGPHAPYANVDGHRMIHSNSAQSFTPPRMAHVPMNYNPAVSSPAQVTYSQPMMQPFIGPGTPQMGQFRSFSNSHQYAQQQGHMAGPMMMQGQFMGPPGMVPAPHMPVYGAHGQFVPPSGAPPQGMPGSNGYPSPGRPSAPMMAHKGSQQGQNIYGMSPNTQYQQPAFVPQQPGGQGRGFNNSGAQQQQLGTSPQQMHPYGLQQRNGSNNYPGKNFGAQGQHQNPQGQSQGRSTSANTADHALDASSESK